MRGGRYPKYLVALWGSACNDHMHTSPHKENLMKRILTICSLSFFAFGCVSFAANQESGSVFFQTLFASYLVVPIGLDCNSLAVTKRH